MSSTNVAPEIGSLIGDRYRILELVGKGGMGAVYRAEHIQLQRNVAVKMLLGDFDQESAEFKRFFQEARAASMLDHPNIVSVHDFGTIGNGKAYIVMDFIAGCALDDVLMEVCLLPIERFYRIFTQACDALDHAHQEGVVHRDIKPSNIMLVKRGRDADYVKIVDFGLAKLTSFEGLQEKLTSSNTLVGSPLFMSPEQCRGLELDHRSDIYSLGCVMYRALSGTNPVCGETPMDTLFKHISAEPIPISQVNPKAVISPEVEQLIMKALAKNPADRQQSMAQLREEIDAALPTFVNTGSISGVTSTSALKNVGAVEVVPSEANMEPPPQLVPEEKEASGKHKGHFITFCIRPVVFLSMLAIIVWLSLDRAINSLHDSSGVKVPLPAKPQIPLLSSEEPAQEPEPVKPKPKPHPKPVVKPAPPVVAVQPEAAKPVEPAKPVVQKQFASPQALLADANQIEGLGEQAFNDGRYADALQLFLKSLAQKEQLNGPQDPRLMPTIGQVAMAYSALHDEQNSAAYFKRFVEMWSVDPGPMRKRDRIRRGVASVATQLGSNCARAGQPEAANTYYKWAAAIGPKAVLNGDGQPPFADQRPFPNRPRPFQNRFRNRFGQQ